MNAIGIVQARMGSTRLPGKTMLPIAGKPMIGYLAERLELVKGCSVVHAIPAGDDALDDYLTGRGNKVYRHFGDENDVAGRFAAVLKEYPGHDAFVRICADSPLLDPKLVDAALTLYEPPYFCIRSPVGCVEVCDVQEFLEGLGDLSPEEREHVTGKLFWWGGGSLTLGDEDAYRLVVDTQEDFDRVARVIGRMDGDHRSYGWRECVSLSSAG